MNNVSGDDFGNQSSLMVHLLTLATCWFDLRQKQHFFLFSRFLQIEEALFICTANYVLFQIYKCGSIVNPQQLDDAKLITLFICTMNHVLSQMYKCCLAMLLRKLNSSTIGAVRNFSTTELDFSKIFQQLFKCIIVVLCVTTTIECFDD